MDDTDENKGYIYTFAVSTVQLQLEIIHHFVELQTGAVLCLLNAEQPRNHLQKVAHFLFINIGTRHVCHDNKIAFTQILLLVSTQGLHALDRESKVLGSGCSGWEMKSSDPAALF